MDKSLPIDIYEERQSKYSRRTRGSSHRGVQDALILSRHERESLLMEWGVTFNEMIDAIRTNVKIKNQRRRTVNAIGTYDRIEEIMENTASKLKGKLKLKKNSTGNGTVVASYNHGAVVPTTTSRISSKQQRQKIRTLLHSNQIPPTNRSNIGTAGDVDGRRSDQLSIRSSISSDNSNSGSSSAFGGSSSDKVSNSTTTSTSNVAVCYDEKKYNHPLHKNQTDLASIDAISEANDFSTDIRTPASTIIDTDNEKQSNGDDLNTNPTTTAATNKSDTNSVNNNDTEKVASTLYDLDDEIEKAITALATEKKQEKKHRSSSFDDRGGNRNVIDDLIKPRRQLSNTATKVGVPPIIGVDIPRDVNLQRSMSIESGLTYDPHLLNTESNHSYGTAQQHNDDGISALAYDIDYDSNEFHDVNDDDDVTIPSKLLHDFNELMINDCHPNSMNTSKNRANELICGYVPASDMPSHNKEVQLQQTAADMPYQNMHNRFHQSCHLPMYNHTTEEQDTNIFNVIGDGVYDENYIADSNAVKSLMTESEYDESYLHITDHPLSPISELTGIDQFQNSFNSRSTASSYLYRKSHPEDGNFDKLQRDSSFWGICPGVHDEPQIRRVMMPVTITEDASLDPSPVNHFDVYPYDSSRMSEGHHSTTNRDNFRYQSEGVDEVNASTPYPNMIFSNHEMLPSKYNENMALPPHNTLRPVHAAAGLPIKNLTNSQHVGLTYQHRQHDVSINNGMMHHYSPTAMYPTANFPLPSSSYVPKVDSFVPTEWMNISENGNAQYPPNEHHATMYKYNIDPANAANTEKWDEYGFRLEPPPNSTTLLHKMMM
jgi:hypothetical protein